MRKDFHVITSTVFSPLNAGAPNKRRVYEDTKTGSRVYARFLFVVNKKQNYPIRVNIDGLI